MKFTPEEIEKNKELIKKGKIKKTKKKAPEPKPQKINKLPSIKMDLKNEDP